MILYAVDIALIIGSILLAICALISRNVFAGIVFYISLGLLVTLSWVKLGAIDVAIAEAAIGAGVTGAMLLGAWRKLAANAQDADGAGE